MGAGALAAITAIAPLVEKYGLPLIVNLLATFNQPEDWAGLLKLTSRTARQDMIDTLTAHGIDPASPAGMALIALTPA